MVGVGEEHRIGRRLWCVGQRSPQDARQRLWNGLLVLLRRGDHDLEALDRAGEPHVERRDRFADDRLRGRFTPLLPLIGEERLQLPRHGGEHPPDRSERARAVDHHPRRMRHEFAVEVGEHDEIELEPLRLVDRHHPDRRGHRIGHARSAALGDEGGGAGEAHSRAAGRQIPGPRRLDELLEPPGITLRPARGRDGGEPAEHGAVAVVDELAPQPVDRRDAPRGRGRGGGGRLVEPEGCRQWRPADVKAGDRVGGMVAEREHREQKIDRRGVVERIAPLGAGHDVFTALEPGDHLLGRVIGAHEHADPRGRIRPRERRGPRGGVRENHVGLLLVFLGHRRRPQPNPAGQIAVPGRRGVGDECFSPASRHGSMIRQRLAAGQFVEHLIHDVEHGGARAVALRKMQHRQRRRRLVEEVGERIDQFGLAAAPAVDRLLVVTHGEETAAARGRVLREAFEHPPLRQ